MISCLPGLISPKQNNSVLLKDTANMPQMSLELATTQFQVLYSTTKPLYFNVCFVKLRYDGEERAGCFVSLYSWCLVIVVWLFLVLSWVCLQFVIVVFLDHTHYVYAYFIGADKCAIMV